MRKKGHLDKKKTPNNGKTIRDLTKNGNNDKSREKRERKEE